MEVVIYYAGSQGVMYEQRRFKAKTLTKARKLVREWFLLENVHAEWNIKKAWMTSTQTEAHIYGFCKDEHVAIVLEDKGKCDYLTEEWFEVQDGDINVMG